MAPRTTAATKPVSRTVTSVISTRAGPAARAAIIWVRSSMKRFSLSCMLLNASAAERTSLGPSTGTAGAPKPSVLILGNGPSLAEDLPRLIARGEHTAKDVMAVNYFALDERFGTVRSAYYVLSDPMFFRDSVCRDRVAELYRTLAEKVTWPMNLYVQYYNPERFD